MNATSSTSTAKTPLNHHQYLRGDFRRFAVEVDLIQIERLPYAVVPHLNRDPTVGADQQRVVAVRRLGRQDAAKFGEEDGGGTHLLNLPTFEVRHLSYEFA